MNSILIKDTTKEEREAIIRESMDCGGSCENCSSCWIGGGSPCWMLNKKFQGKGYAYEAAYAFFDYLFRDKGARRIYAYTEDYNLPSQHLCEKLGMRREGLFVEFVSFVNNPDGTPLYENTMQYAILKKGSTPTLLQTTDR